jgi:hypothetical protein
VDISSFASIIGALGIGSFVGQYLIGSQQRRQIRSEVLRQLSHAESARWAGSSNYLSFTEAIRELETAALIARVPRKVIANYTLFAYAARTLSEEDAEENPDQEFGGGINAHFGDLVRAAASEVSRSVWSPWIGRLGAGHRMKQQRNQAAQIEQDAHEPCSSASGQLTLDAEHHQLPQSPHTRELPPRPE